MRRLERRSAAMAVGLRFLLCDGCLRAIYGVRPLRAMSACMFCLGALSEVSNGGFAYLSPAIAWKKEGVPKDSFMIALM